MMFDKRLIMQGGLTMRIMCEKVNDEDYARVDNEVDYAKVDKDHGLRFDYRLVMTMIGS